MNLPTCPREDCTASERHYHRTTTLNPDVAVKCSASPAYCQQNHDGSAPSVSRCYAPRTPQPQPAAVVLPTVEEAARVIPEAWANPSSVGSVHLIAAKAVLDLMAARLPVWQPVEPGAVIKAGPLYRIEWDADDTEGRSAIERTYADGFTLDPTDPARFYVDPRTEDPAVAVVAEWWEQTLRGSTAKPGPSFSDLLARIDAARADA